MKRLRGACKGCKCAAERENGEYECMASDRFRRMKQPPKVCDKRIDAETYLEDGGQNETREEAEAALNGGPNDV